jgi:hypothetical protein
MRWYVELTGSDLNIQYVYCVRAIYPFISHTVCDPSRSQQSPYVYHGTPTSYNSVRCMNNMTFVSTDLTFFLFYCIISIGAP